MEQNLNQNSNFNNSQQTNVDANKINEDGAKSMENTSMLNNNNNTTTNSNTKVVTVEVPVAVPVQVPVEIQVPVAVAVPVDVPVPVYVPVAVPVADNTEIEATLKAKQQQQQQQQQFQQTSLPQTSNYVPFSSTSMGTNENMNTSMTNNNNNNNNITPEHTDINVNLPKTMKTSDENKITSEYPTEDLLKLDLNEVKNNITSGVQQVTSTLNNIIESGKEQLRLNKTQEETTTKIEKPQSQVFSQAQQPLVSQALEEEDKKSVTDTYISPQINENEKINNNNFDINELHDIKKEHKELSNNLNNNNSTINNLMNQAKETFNSGIELIKNNLGFNSNVHKTEEAKQPLVSQALEEEDKKPVNVINNTNTSNVTTNNDTTNTFEINELHDVKKEHKTNTNVETTNVNSRMNNVMDQTKDMVNNSVETLKNTLGFDNKENKITKEFDQEKQPLMKQPLEREDRTNNETTTMSSTSTNIPNDEKVIYEKPIILQGTSNNLLGQDIKSDINVNNSNESSRLQDTKNDKESEVVKPINSF